MGQCWVSGSVSVAKLLPLKISRTTLKSLQFSQKVTKYENKVHTVLHICIIKKNPTHIAYLYIVKSECVLTLSKTVREVLHWDYQQITMPLSWYEMSFDSSIKRLKGPSPRSATSSLIKWGAITFFNKGRTFGPVQSDGGSIFKMCSA